MPVDKCEGAGRPRRKGGTYGDTAFVNWWVWAAWGSEIDYVMRGDDVVRVSSFGEVPALCMSPLLLRSTTNAQRPTYGTFAEEGFASGSKDEEDAFLGHCVVSAVLSR